MPHHDELQEAESRIEVLEAELHKARQAKHEAQGRNDRPRTASASSGTGRRVLAVFAGLGAITVTLAPYVKLFDPRKTGVALVPISLAQMLAWQLLFNGVSRLVAPFWGFKEYRLENRDGGNAVWIWTGGHTHFSRAQGITRTVIGAALSTIAAALFAKFA